MDLEKISKRSQKNRKESERISRNPTELAEYNHRFPLMGAIANQGRLINSELMSEWINQLTREAEQ